MLIRTQQAGAVRADLTGLDVLQLFEMLTPALRKSVDAPLSEPPPSWGEIIAVWKP